MCDYVIIIVRWRFDMCTITATEFKKNFGKYMDLGQKEEIQVTHRGKKIFTIVPERLKLIAKTESLFGILPREAYDDKDIDRE